VFAALNSLRLNLLGNNQTGITNALAALQTASSH